jgi:uncharacterized protein (TIGR02757 family)
MKRLSEGELKRRLDAEAARRDREGEVSYEKPDPILVALRHRDEWSALLCALFGYGRADAIVAFLDRFDFSLLEGEEGRIRRELGGFYYRFQNGEDIIQFVTTLRRLRQESSLEESFKTGYAGERSVIAGVNALIAAMGRVNGYRSRGYSFLIGREAAKTRGNSPMKRWMMFLRWMVRKDAIDMGLWRGVERSDLLIPLDTHTFNVSRRLGLLERRSYDLQASIELTDALRRFDPEDPVRYDFALYRLGQERKVSSSALKHMVVFEECDNPQPRDIEKKGRQHDDKIDIG